MVEHTEVEFLSEAVSDHSPAVISIAKLKNFGPKPFKYLSFWAEHVDFFSWVEEGWQLNVEGSPMFRLYSKLKSVKRVLKAKNLEVF